MVFSLASLLDPEQPPCSSQAKEYMLLSRLALRCGSPVEDTTLWAIQALVRTLNRPCKLVSNRIYADISRHLYAIPCRHELGSAFHHASCVGTLGARR